MSLSNVLPRAARPQVGAHEAVEILRDAYGLGAEVLELPGESDRNFLVTLAKAHWVLKIAPAEEAPSTLEAQHAAFRWIRDRDPGLCPPLVRVALDGREIVEVTAGDGRAHLARLIAYLPGTPLAEAPRPRDPGLIADLGEHIGRLSVALRGFDHVGVRRTIPWDLQHGLRVATDHVDAVRDAARWQQIRDVLDLLRNRLEPSWGLPEQTIHGDANDENVLLSTGGGRVAGVIDYGDLVWSWRVGEIAIAAAYAIIGDVDPARVLLGMMIPFADRVRLRQVEAQLFVPLVALRLCVSITVAAGRRAAGGTNPHHFQSEAGALAALGWLEDRIDLLTERVVGLADR